LEQLQEGNVERTTRVVAMVITRGCIVFAFLDRRDPGMSRYARTRAAAAATVIAVRACGSA
jgi:hypothetical protein